MDEVLMRFLYIYIAAFVTSMTRHIYPQLIVVARSDDRVRAPDSAAKRPNHSWRK
jgi:hypothetical protein